MSLSLGLVGLPNAGKSTLFNALSKAGAQVAAYPFTTIEPNVGIVRVPDRRLQDLARIVKPDRVVPTTIEFVDIAGLVKGSSHGEGLGNQFLGHIRNVHAILLIVRCFANPDVPHVYGEVDPLRDIEILNSELCLADVASVERRIEKTRQASKSGDKRYLKELETLAHLQEHLNQGKPARSFRLDTATSELTDDPGLMASLLTGKPVLYVANVGEDDLAKTLAIVDCRETDGAVLEIKHLATREGAELAAVSAELEAELAELPEDEAAAYLKVVGVNESGLNRLIRASYHLLNLVTFFTSSGEKEVRAWTVVRGTTAPEAAGQVHSDMERGFIRAEVINCDELARGGSFATARERGLVKVEGRDYVVQDGDVIHFRFNV